MRGNKGVIQFYSSLMGLFRLTRTPNLFIIALTQYVAAVFLVFDKSYWLEVLTDYRFLFLVLSTTMIAGAGYIINDYYDTKIDYVNRPKRVIVGRIIDRRYVLAIYFSLNAVAVLIGVWLSKEVALVHFVSTVFLWLHSNQLKRLPLLGNFIIGFLSGMTLLIVAVFYARYNSLVYAYSFFALVINIIREILKDLEAVKGEEKFGSHALPSVLGMRRTKQLIYFLIFTAAVALTFFLYKTENIIAITYFLILIPVFVYFIYRLVKADSQQKFAALGDFANFIMLTGIISITLF